MLQCQWEAVLDQPGTQHCHTGDPACHAMTCKGQTVSTGDTVASLHVRLLELSSSTMNSMWSIDAISFCIVSFVIFNLLFPSGVISVSIEAGLREFCHFDSHVKPPDDSVWDPVKTELHGLHARHPDIVNAEGIIPVWTKFKSFIESFLRYVTTSYTDYLINNYIENFTDTNVIKKLKEKMSELIKEINKIPDDNRKRVYLDILNFVRIVVDNKYLDTHKPPKFTPNSTP